MNDDRINKEKAKETIERSGYLLESRLESILREHNFLVDSNCFYTDSKTQKKREIDLLAVGYSSVNLFDSNIIGIGANLIIECKNYSQPLAFIDNDSRKNCEYFNITAREEIAVASGRPEFVIINGINHTLSEFASNTKAQFYNENICIASQYFTFFKNGKNEWRAAHSSHDTNKNESEHDLFEKLCTYLDIQKQSFWETYGKGVVNPDINFAIFYPVMVLQGDLWRISTDSSKKVVIHDEQHILHLRNHIKGSEEKRYHIDVVTEAYFPQYLTMIQEQLDAIANNIMKHKREFQEATQRHADKQIPMKIL